MPLQETDVIRIRQFIQRMESGLILGQQVFVTYHDSNLAATPTNPTGNGTTGGWHRLATEASNWMSVKTALSDSAGTWGTPIRVFGLQGTETAGVGLSADIPKLSQITFIGDGSSKVGWTAGTVEYEGSSYAIAVKAVGDGSTNAYIYWDDADGQTSFKTTATLATAIAANHHYVCRNDSGVATPAWIQRIILGGVIQAGTINAAIAIIAKSVTSSELTDALNADIAQGIADAATAQGAADDAQADATTGIADAASAQAELDEIAADTKVTPVEKLEAKQRWDAIVVEGTPITGTIPAQATAFSITFSSAWLGIDDSNLVSHCGSEPGNFTLVNALKGDWGWDHDTNEAHEFILDLGALYYISNLKSFSLSAAGDPIDVDVYVSETNGDWGAAVASGISTWQDTSSYVEVIPTGKVGQYIKVVVNETEDAAFHKLFWGKASMQPVFDAYGGRSDFDIAYAALDLYLNTTISVFDSMSTTTTITRSDWDTAWKDYYDERTQLLNAIATAAKDLADAAQADADTAQAEAEAKIKTFFQDAVPTAENAGDIWFDTNDGLKMHRATAAGDDQVTGGEWEHVDLTIIDGGNLIGASVLAAAIATYNLTAANATIENLMVKTAMIDNLNVTTIKIADNAATIPSGASAAGPISLDDDAWKTVISVTYTSTGEAVIINAGCINGATMPLHYGIFEDSTQLYSTGQIDIPVGYPWAGTIIRTPSAAEHTFALKCYKVGTGVPDDIYVPSITVAEFKK